MHHNSKNVAMKAALPSSAHMDLGVIAPQHGYPDITTPHDFTGDLSERDRQMLENESAITPDAITARGYFTTSDRQQLQKMGFAQSQLLPPALVVPLFNVLGERVSFAIRPQIPREGRKYEIPAGNAPTLDVSPLVASDINDPTKPLFITEGAKKADAAASRGLCCINLNGVFGYRGRNAKGGITALPDWENVALKSSKKARSVYIVFDSDVTTKSLVESAMRRLAAFLQYRGAAVKIVYLPDGPNGEKRGLDDFFANGGEVSALYELARDLSPIELDKRKIKAEKQKAVAESLKASGLPLIETNNRQQRDVLLDMADAIGKANQEKPHLFHGATGLVSVALDKDELPFIAQASRETIQREAATSANWTSTTEREGIKNVAPPRDLCESFRTAQKWWRHIEPLDGIITAPIVAKTGDICSEPGYNPAARLWLAPCADFSTLDTEPTLEKLEAAKKLILSRLLGEVAFSDEASRAHAVALMILPFVRRLIDGPTPLHLFDAPTQSSGKSYAAKICVAPFAEPTPSAEKGDEEEWRKALLAALLSGRSHIFLDNIKGRLNSPMLASALTEPSITERALGGLGEVRAPVRCVWVATSNNARFDPDSASRCVVIRLDTEMENPESRKYKGDPLRYIHKHRVEVIGAILTLVRHWQESGSPAYSGPNQSRYGNWQRVIGGILEACGIPGFLDNLDEYRETLDPEKAAWSEFFAVWFQAFGSHYRAAKELLPLVIDNAEISALLGDRDFADVQAKKLGRYLAARRGKVFGGLKLIIGPSSGGVKTYRLEDLKGGKA